MTATQLALLHNDFQYVKAVLTIIAGMLVLIAIELSLMFKEDD